MQLRFLFGKSGVGKSYVSAVCVEVFGFTQYEGDRDLTADMKQAITAQQRFTPAMRAAFAEVLARNVRSAWSELTIAEPRSPGLVVCQGLFKERERRWLSECFPEARWLWVRTSPELLRERLARRTAHAASSEYAEIINADFEPPQLPHDVLDNDGDRESVIRQLKALE
jgi:gluconate kinase